MQMTHGSAARLTFGDDIFVRRHRRLGSPVVNQLVWRFDRALPAGALDSMRDALAAGALSRRVDRALVPGARARWSRVDERPALLDQVSPLAAGEVMPWVLGLVATPLDPTRGSAWRLASVPTDDGGQVVSLLVSHAVADGGAMIDAVERACSGAPALRVPDRPALPSALAGDLRDAVGRTVAAGRWLSGAARTVRPRLRRGRAAAPLADPPVPRAAAVDGPWRAPMAVLECRTADIAAAAARLGGTPNAWFVAVAADVATAARGADAPPALTIALPVSSRSGDDPRANATRIASVTVEGVDLGARDLARVRAACKDAYAALGPAATDAPSPLALVQMLPDAVVRRLPQPPAAAVLASNLGTLSDDFCTIGGVRARSVTAVAGLQDATAADVRAMGGGLMAWAASCGDRTTVSVAVLDPDGITDDAALAELVGRTLRAWDVEASPW